MHYKTTSLSDSIIGRAFVKEALDKGLIEAPEAPSPYAPINEAFNKLEAYRPDTNLASNILKLCSGLRQQGLVSYAESIEEKFIQFKQANALYDVSGEKGEDLINAAHPEGGHDMKGVEGDATIETILERAKKMQEVVNKMPTGKLATKDALNIARVILAQTKLSINLMAAPEEMAKTKSTEQLGKEVGYFWQLAKNKWQHIRDIVKDKGQLSSIPIVGRGIDFWSIEGPINTNFSENPTIESIDALKDDLKDGTFRNVKRLISPGFTGGVTKDAWELLGEGEDINKLVDVLTYTQNLIKAQLQQTRGARLKEEDVDGGEAAPPASAPSAVYTKVQAAINDSLATLNDWKPTVNAFEDEADRSAGSKWIADTENALHGLLQGVSPQADLATLNAHVIPSLQKIEKDMIDFYNAWIKE